MKNFSGIVSWMVSLIGIELVDDEQPSLENPDLVTNAVAPESNCRRPSVPYDPNFQFIPIPLPPDCPKSKENRHKVIHMPDESNDEPDSYVRYDSSSGRADTSGIEAYWNRPPPKNFIPPPPYWPPVSYVPPPPPEHVEAVRYQPPVKEPAAQREDEVLIHLRKSLETSDLVKNAVAPESNSRRPSVPYDPNFQFIPIPLPPDRTKSKENRHKVIHMPDESNDEPDSYVRYDSSSGRADTSGIQAYWNRPPKKNFIPPPPDLPPVSYVPPTPPEHVEAVRYQPPVKEPAAQKETEVLIHLRKSLETSDLVTNAVAPASNCRRPSVPYDPNFQFIPIPLPPDRTKSKENRHTVIHMPDESNDEPDSYVRYDSSSGRADTSRIEAYWNHPPPENFIPPPPYWPPVSYVPPPPPEHVEAYRYEPTVKTPSAQTGDEDLITEHPDYGTTSLGVQHELDSMREKVTKLSQLIQLEQMKNFDLRQRFTKLEAEKDELRKAYQTAPSAYQNGEVRASQHQAWGREPPQNQAQVTKRRQLAELEKEKEQRKRNAESRPKDQRKVNFFQQFLPPPFCQWNVRTYLAHKNPKTCNDAFPVRYSNAIEWRTRKRSYQEPLPRRKTNLRNWDQSGKNGKPLISFALGFFD
ncbi:Uncharacterized protein APZ42_034491 [Daphnia magna]|uniref:Uncharacterized protein n=1 Tax=Daphnia magna TaxID=35525 RepID=A0A164K8B7_9CRUS|nr:Uncharacterized protein APZ42_034491 [Daphnia magna]